MVMVLKELEKVLRRGIYAISQHVSDNPTRNRVFTVRIGRTIDFKNRLDSYNLCWNSGFRVIALLGLQPRTK